MEEDNTIEEYHSDSEEVDGEYPIEHIEHIEDKIGRLGFDFKLEDDSLGLAFLTAGTRRKISLINHISELLDSMKEYINVELEELNELHKKID